MMPIFNLVVTVAVWGGALACIWTDQYAPAAVLLIYSIHLRMDRYILSLQARGESNETK